MGNRISWARRWLLSVLLYQCRPLLIGLLMKQVRVRKEHLMRLLVTLDEKLVVVDREHLRIGVLELPHRDRHRAVAAVLGRVFRGLFLEDLPVRIRFEIIRPAVIGGLVFGLALHSGIPGE